ncbi:hypothetical protein [Oricola indica]|uniref:hypothetical protein n=1 Tax=Oricola indica TaxID=2872591 RepID=UPI001CBACE05|nr:hypothetical protein [Oricola indica]
MPRSRAAPAPKLARRGAPPGFPQPLAEIANHSAEKTRMAAHNLLAECRSTFGYSALGSDRLEAAVMIAALEDFTAMLAENQQEQAA